MKKKTFATICAVLASAVLLSSCSVVTFSQTMFSDLMPRPSTELEIGESVETERIKTTVKSVAFSEEFIGFPASTGKNFLLIEVTEENLSDTTIYLSTYDFKIDALSLVTFLLPEKAEEWDKKLRSSGELEKGESLSSYLLFAVPADTEVFQLLYTSPNVTESHEVTIYTIARDQAANYAPATPFQASPDEQIVDLEDAPKNAESSDENPAEDDKQSEASDPDQDSSEDSSSRSEERYLGFDTSPGNRYKIGESIKNNWFTFTVSKVTFKKMYHNRTAAEGHIFLIVDLHEENTWDKTTDFYPHDYFIDSPNIDDFVYPLAPFDEGMRPETFSLEVGESLRSSLVFEIPEDTGMYYFVFEEYYSDDSPGDTFYIELLQISLGNRGEAS